jgi:hypothetical protein
MSQKIVEKEVRSILMIGAEVFQTVLRSHDQQLQTVHYSRKSRRDNPYWESRSDRKTLTAQKRGN